MKITRTFQDILMQFTNAFSFKKVCKNKNRILDLRFKIFGVLNSVHLKIIR